MSEDLLDYYNRELAFVRQMAAEFAEKHPRVAGHLRLSRDTVEDPHVSRLIEAFAFLNARTRMKLDDDFPELTDALLDVLYPHFLAPIPSMAIAQFGCDPASEGAVTLPRGTEIDTEPVGREPCRFRTCFDTTVWPIKLDNAQFYGSPIVAPPNPRAPHAPAALRLTLSCVDDGMTFTDLAPDTVRFFLRGQPQTVYPLYEALFNDAVSVAFADGPSDQSPVICDTDVIRAVGFEEDEGMLPYSPRSFIGYRLLTEFFVFPEKFLFFDIAGFDGKTLRGAGRTLEIFVYFDRSSTVLERGVSESTFALGCAPIVNLFKQRADPIRLTQTTHEYRVVPDARRPRGVEVYSVDDVAGTTKEGERVSFNSFFGLHHAETDSPGHRYWHARREQSIGKLTGSQTYLALVDLAFQPNVPEDLVLSIETTCLNRDVPADLPFGGGQPALDLSEPNAAITSISCVTAPTPTLRPPRGEEGYFGLVSHLALNHLSLVGDEAAASLREILSLYDFRNAPETRSMIGGVVDVRAEAATARAPGGVAGAVCRGLQIHVTLDPGQFTGQGLYLMASVLERFFGMYTWVNGFTQLVAHVRGRKGAPLKWPPRAGDQTLI